MSRAALLALSLAFLLAWPAAAETSPQARLAAAENLQAQGKRREALRELEQLAAALPADGDALAAATVGGARGKAHLLAGDKEAARKHLEAALEAARRIGAPALESSVQNDLGQLELIEERPQRALAAFAAARSAAEAAGRPLLFARAVINSVRAEPFEPKAGRQGEALDEAQRRLAAVPDSPDKAYQLIAIANLQRRLAGEAGAPQGAWRALAEALRIGAALEDARVESFALGHLGELYAAAGRAGEALRLTRRALFLAQLANAPDALYRWHWQLARQQAAAGRAEEAMASYQRAIDSLQGIRSDLMADLRAIRASYRDAVGPLFLEYADLLLRRALDAGGAEGAQRRGWLLKARDSLEQLKTVELEDYFQDECVASLQARKKAVDDLPAGTAVLYPILLADRVEMLISLPGEIRQVRLAVDSRTLGEEILSFRRMLEKRTTHQYLPHAQKLHGWLIRPIEAELAGIHTLVIVPDGPLRGIPLAALHDGKQFLVERYAVAVAPGLTLVEDAAAPQAKRGTLMGGLTESVQNFPALPYVEPEMQAIQALYGGKSLKDAQFMMPRFEQELRDASYSVVHIASHGQIESDPRKSFLLAYDGKITMDHLEGYLKFSRLKEGSIDLLTLSACRTAAGDDRAALGLAGMAVKAGARSALATLWYVSDQASSMLVTAFYGELSAGGHSKAAALRSAQRMLLADARYRHPGYWAPFLLIGNWQ